jgi:hypothetical protein
MSNIKSIWSDKTETDNNCKEVKSVMCRFCGGIILLEHAHRCQDDGPGSSWAGNCCWDNWLRTTE